MSLASKRKWEDPIYREKERLHNSSFIGHHHTEESRQKISEGSKQNWQDPAFREKVKQGHQNSEKGIHKKGVMETIQALTEKGFRCIPLIQAPIPDAIAIRGNNVFAVEYETGVKSADFEKYAKVGHPFDDIIWVIQDKMDFTKLVKVREE